MATTGLGEFIMKNVSPQIKPVYDLLLQEETPEKAKICNKIVLSLATVDDTKLLSIIVRWKRSRHTNLPKNVDEQILDLLINHYNQHKDESEENKSIPLVTMYKMLSFENHVVRLTVKKLQAENLIKPIKGGRWMAIMESVENLCIAK